MDLQMGEMDLRLGVVDDLATELLVHGLPGDALVLHVGVLVDVDAMGIA